MAAALLELVTVRNPVVLKTAKKENRAMSLFGHIALYDYKISFLCCDSF